MIGSPQNTFNTMPKPQANPQQLATALQNYGQAPQTAPQMSNTNYTMPGGQGNAPYGFNAYTQGLNKSTNMQPMLPNPQLAQAQQY
jgi:hypothetical protein